MPSIRVNALALLIISLWLVSPHGYVRPAPEKACNFVQNTDFQRISWKGSLPIHLNVSANVPKEAYSAIKNAIATYAEMMKKPVFVIDNWHLNSNKPEKDGVSVIYWMNHWESDRTQEQARTTLYWNGSQIYEADIRVNAANFGFIFGPRNPASIIDLESLLVHEFGHVLGLAHDATHGSVMNFSLDDGQIRRQLGRIDLASLHCEY